MSVLPNNIQKIYTLGFFVINTGQTTSSVIPQASASNFNDFGVYNTLATASLVVQGCPDLVNSSSVWLNVLTVPSSSIGTFGIFAFDGIRVQAASAVTGTTQIQLLGGIDPEYISLQNV